MLECSLLANANYAFSDNSISAQNKSGHAGNVTLNPELLQICADVDRNTVRRSGHAG